jgi:putative LysE/RhtB family amino acid efflux pump
LDPLLLLKGVALGVAIAAPVGPIGVLCIRRTLIYGRRVGLLTGVGAGLADGVFGILAASGLVALSDWLTWLRTPIHLVGGAVLLILAVRTLITAGDVRVDPDTRTAVTSGTTAAFSAFGLTLTNPLTILTFATAFTGVGLVDSLTIANGAILVAGVTLGSIAWFMTLSTAVGASGSKLTPQRLLWIDRTAGALLLVFALYMFVAVWWPL